MTSEQPTPPLRMPSHLFEELAAGGGSSEALAFLARGERVRRLLLLRTLLARLDAVPTPLDPPAEAWRTLKSAAARDPGPVERLLLAPQTGGWLAHVLRRLHGTAAGPTLWAETGHLNALAVSAALRAGTEADLRVPLADGALILPGLGMARLPGAPRGLSVGRAKVRDGELNLVSEATDVPALVLPDPAPVPVHAAKDVPDPAPHWVPLRTLTLAGPSGTAAVPLDDLDPYRDLDDPIAPARLDAEEAAEWQRLFDEAVGIVIARGMYGPGRLDPAEIRAVVPWGRTSVLPAAPPTVRLSASSGDSYGGMVIARPAAPSLLRKPLSTSSSTANWAPCSTCSGCWTTTARSGTTPRGAEIPGTSPVSCTARTRSPVSRASGGTGWPRRGGPRRWRWPGITSRCVGRRAVLPCGPCWRAAD